jgi:pimeloyl-ACP methyl ester carboxylesterase
LELERISVPVSGASSAVQTRLVRGDGGPEGIGVLLVPDAERKDARAEALLWGLASAGCAVLVPELDPGAGDRPALRALEAAAAFLAREARLDPRRIAAVGLGRGGTLALLLACTTSCVHALVTFDAEVLYPELDAARPIQPLELLLNLGAPWLAFFAAEGARVPAADVALLRARLEASGKHHELVLGPAAAARSDPASGSAARETEADLVGGERERTLSFLREAL